MHMGVVPFTGHFPMGQRGLRIEDGPVPLSIRVVFLSVRYAWAIITLHIPSRGVDYRNSNVSGDDGHMRHGASLMVSLEGMSQPAYRVAKELSGNSRSGLTVRFLAKKLELPTEEVEYLIDVHERLFFNDLTKVKIVAEGHGVVKRIAEGLESRGDVPSLLDRIKGLSPHDFRRLEEQLGLEEPSTKRATADAVLERFYQVPEAVLTHVGTGDFSETAREIFDIVWQSKDGVLPVSQLQAIHGGSAYEIEQALVELLSGYALFEMFRFDAEDRLVRVAGILKEVRAHRTFGTGADKPARPLKALRGKIEESGNRALQFSETICRLVAAIAAKPVRMRGDGELFREDRRRLSGMCPEESEPSLNTCLWVAEGVGWLVRVENTLSTGELESIIEMERVHRHLALCDWMLEQGDDVFARNLLASYIDEIKVGACYDLHDFTGAIMGMHVSEEQLSLRQQNGKWGYESPNLTGQAEGRFSRALQETFFWLGMVERGYKNDEPAIKITELGAAVIQREISAALAKAYPKRKGELVVQPNFDIVVPSDDMDPLLTVPLDQFAIRASTGQATVYNVTKESFTQAVQDGHDAVAFVEFLLAHNRGGGLPANVMTTLEDWRGGMKQVRIRTIQVVESDDPLVLADLIHRRRFQKYLQPIDGRQIVRYEGIELADLTRTLEKEGFIVE
jgi:hypothetical protein